MIVYKIVRKKKSFFPFLSDKYYSLFAKGRYQIEYKLGREVEAPAKTLGIYGYKSIVVAIKMLQQLIKGNDVHDAVIISCWADSNGSKKGRAGCPNEVFLDKFYGAKAKDRKVLPNFDGAYSFRKLVPQGVILSRLY